MNRIFLSYAHENLDVARKVYKGLKERNLDIWFDKEELGPGLWKRKIEKAIPKSRYFVICISNAALKKTGDEPGFQDEELQQAYEIARVQPEDAFTIVPVRLEDCGRGDHRLSPYQQYDLFKDFESELDHLAVNLGGVSLTDKFAEDTRTEEEKLLENLHGKAVTFHYAGEFVKCLEVCGLIISIKPEDSLAWNNKGNALSAVGRKDEAIEAYNTALGINPGEPAYWYNKGNALADLGGYHEAIEAYDKALGILPGFGEAWYSKGTAFSALGRSDEALESYDKSLEIRPEDAKAWYNKGLDLVRLDRFDEAIIASDKALEIQPDYTHAWTNKGIALCCLDRFDEAVAAFDRALKIKRDDVWSWYNKGNALSAIGRKEKAIAAYEKALGSSGKNDFPRTDLIRKIIAELKAKKQ